MADEPKDEVPKESLRKQLEKHPEKFQRKGKSRMVSLKEPTKIQKGWTDPRTQFVYKFVKFVLVYGFFLNVVAFVIFNIQFTISNWVKYWIALGILYYFIKRELPEIVKGLRR